MRLASTISADNRFLKSTVHRIMKPTSPEVARTTLMIDLMTDILAFV